MGGSWHPGKNFVDFDEDLQFKDRNAVQGFDNIELLKRYTTVGMGPSQGSINQCAAYLARVTGKSPGEVGTTTARPFVHPVPLSHLAGRGFTPERQTPLHSRHAALCPVHACWRLAKTGVLRPTWKELGQLHLQEAEAVRTRVIIGGRWGN